MYVTSAVIVSVNLQPWNPEPHLNTCSSGFTKTVLPDEPQLKTHMLLHRSLMRGHITVLYSSQGCRIVCTGLCSAGLRAACFDSKKTDVSGVFSLHYNPHSPTPSTLSVHVLVNHLFSADPNVIPRTHTIQTGRRRKYRLEHVCADGLPYVQLLHHDRTESTAL